MFKHFRIVPFIAGLGIGYYLLTIYKTEPRTILVYPHPSNIHSQTFRDKNGVCYGYTAKDVICDQHEQTIKPYPIQG